MLERTDTDAVIAKTDVWGLVEAFLWHAESADIVAVLVRAGVSAGRRVGGFGGWQRAILISTLG